MENAYPADVLKNYGEVVESFFVVDDVTNVVTEILSAIEDMADENSTMAKALARAGKAYLEKLEEARITISDYCRAADVDREQRAAPLETAAKRHQQNMAQKEPEPRITAEALAIIEADYLRPEKPSFASCYQRLVKEFAIPRGITLPPMQAVKRMLDEHFERMAKIKPAPRR